MIAYSARGNGWGISELAWNYTVSELEVLAALLYYEQHKAEIDAQEKREDDLKAEMKRLHGWKR